MTCTSLCASTINIQALIAFLPLHNPESIVVIGDKSVYVRVGLIRPLRLGETLKRSSLARWSRTMTWGFAIGANALSSALALCRVFS